MSPNGIITFMFVWFSTCMVDLTRSSFDASQLQNSLEGVLDSLSDFVADKDGCRYKCSNGAKPVAKAGHIPSTNGCGSFDLKLDVTHVPAIEKCCDKHDKCYDTCNRLKKTCDDEFHDCLTKICKSMKKHVSNDVYEGCTSTADVMYAGTMALGCKPYKESQRNACVCPRRRNTEL